MSPCPKDTAGLAGWGSPGFSLCHDFFRLRHQQHEEHSMSKETLLSCWEEQDIHSGHWKAAEGFLQVTETMVCILNSPGVCMKQEGTQKYSGGGTETSNIKDTPELGSSPLGSPPQTQQRSWSDHNLFSSRNAPAPFPVLVSATCWAVRAQLCPSLGTWTQCFKCPSPTLSSAGSCFGELTCGRKQSSANTHCSLLLSFPLLTKFSDTSGGLDLITVLLLSTGTVQSSAPALGALQSPSALTLMHVLFHLEAFWNSEHSSEIPGYHQYYHQLLCDLNWC